MLENYSLEWNSDAIRALRLRLGWSRSDMARRLQCETTHIQSLEESSTSFENRLKSELEILYRQAQACSEEVLLTPVCENECDRYALDQIDFLRVKAEFE